MIHIMPYLISGAVWAATEKNTFYAWKKILFGKNIRLDTDQDILAIGLNSVLNIFQQETFE